MNRIQIPITPIKQVDPMECSIVCLRMILSFYGINLSSQDIYNSLLRDLSGGSFNTEIARFAKNKGFNVDCFSYHLGILDPSDAKLSKEELISKLQEQKQHPWFSSDYLLLTDATINALKENVHFIIQIPSKEIIKKYLLDKIPLIASVSYAALHNKQGNIFEGHDIVLNGLEGDKVLFIDPEHAIQEKINIDQLIFAILSRRAISSSAYLIAISK